MKELTIEEKAKAYDVAIEKIQKYVKDDYSCTRLRPEDIFPELNESEDERIRKELISFVRRQIECHDKPNVERDEKFESWIAWLEKQCEQKPQGKLAIEAIKEEKVDNRNYIKPTDKVKPKFHVGDWVVYNNDICQIAKREEGCNKLVTVFGIEKELVNERNLSTARLWTIQDANDGDVLVKDIYPYGMSICLFKEFNPQLFTMKLYCSVDRKGQFLHNHCAYYHRYDVTLYPATKEQRDTLMKAMTDAGYTFDFERKELKKVEPIVVKDFNFVFSKEQVEEIDRRIEESQRLCNAKLIDAIQKVKDFPMTD